MSSIDSNAMYGLIAAAPKPTSVGHVVHLAGVTGLDDQADLGAGAFPDQVVVHGGDVSSSDGIGASCLVRTRGRTAR